MEIPEPLLADFDDGKSVGVYVAERPDVANGEMVIWNHGKRFGTATVTGVSPQNMCFCVILRKMN